MCWGWGRAGSQTQPDGLTVYWHFIIIHKLLRIRCTHTHTHTITFTHCVPAPSVLICGHGNQLAAVTQQLLWCMIVCIGLCVCPLYYLTLSTISFFFFLKNTKTFFLVRTSMSVFVLLPPSILYWTHWNRAETGKKMLLILQRCQDVIWIRGDGSFCESVTAGVRDGEQRRVKESWSWGRGCEWVWLHFSKCSTSMGFGTIYCVAMI